MQTNDQEKFVKENTESANTASRIVASRASLYIIILLAAWFIGISIILAGSLIAKQIAKNANPALTDSQLPAAVLQKVDIEVPAGLPVMGSNDAKVTMIEFADFQCPYCKEWQDTVFDELKAQYIDTGKVRFLFMDYAFLGDESNQAAEAASCANDQNKFWEYHDKLYSEQEGENQGKFKDQNLKRFASELNLDQAQFNSCLDNNTHQDKIINALATGESYGVNSTPTVFINGYKYPGINTFDYYKQVIEAELAK